jgi:hypothetical protein
MERQQRSRSVNATLELSAMKSGCTILGLTLVVWFHAAVSAQPTGDPQRKPLPRVAGADTLEGAPRPDAGVTPPFDDQGRPNRDQPGPWDSDVLVFRMGPDGKTERLATFPQAGVPTVALLHDGRLIAAHQHFPEDNDADFDKVAVRFSSDEGRNWTAPQVIRVEGLPEGMRFPFDPTLVPLPDGRLRLYFTGNMRRPFQRSAPAIHAAISTDGVNYTYEPGVRFAVEGRMVIDCAVVLHRGVFHLYAPDNGVQPQPGQPPRNQLAAGRAKAAATMPRAAMG